MSLSIDLGARSYPIHIGADLLGRADLLQAHLDGGRVMVVSDNNVAPLYLERLLPALAGHEVATEVIAAGEEAKTLATLEHLVGALLRAGCDRQSTLVALGGGVVGDLAGFTAACYQRGIAFIQVPTTLLAQVDSSVGGKTGVNHPLGKNMIGAFHQPRCVIASTCVLATLPERELRCGLAEVIKYGLIGDAGFFEWIDTNLQALLAREPAALATAIERSCRNKAAVVAADERESGARALLNLGHTFGHAIEAGLGYGRWLHGEAVAAGMVAAAEMSRRMGLLEPADAGRVGDLLARAGLPVRIPAALSTDRVVELMGHDKKARHGRIRLVLLRRIGEALVTDDYPVAELSATIDACRA